LRHAARSREVAGGKLTGAGKLISLLDLAVAGTLPPPL
jgi:hypothetical protein